MDDPSDTETEAEAEDERKPAAKGGSVATAEDDGPELPPAATANAAAAVGAAVASRSETASEKKAASRGRPKKKPGDLVKRKPRDMPRRPLSAYNFFFRDQRAILLAERETERNALGEARGGGATKTGLFATLGKEIGKRWKKVTAEDLAKYQEMADKDMERYRQEMSDYQILLAKKRGVVSADPDPPNETSGSPQKKQRKQGAVASASSRAVAEQQDSDSLGVPSERLVQATDDPYRLQHLQQLSGQQIPGINIPSVVTDVSSLRTQLLRPQGADALGIPAGQSIDDLLNAQVPLSAASLAGSHLHAGTGVGSNIALPLQDNPSVASQLLQAQLLRRQLLLRELLQTQQLTESMLQQQQIPQQLQGSSIGSEAGNLFAIGDRDTRLAQMLQEQRQLAAMSALEQQQQQQQQASSLFLLQQQQPLAGAAGLSMSSLQPQQASGLYSGASALNIQQQPNHSLASVLLARQSRAAQGGQQQQEAKNPSYSSGGESRESDD